MEQNAAFLIAAVTLALPGPTNTLFAVSGATAGFRGALRLIPAAILGYVLAVTTLVTVAVPLIAAEPLLGKALRLAVAAVLVNAAFELWRSPAISKRAEAAVANTVGVRHVFLTTLLNPKALVFAMLIMPEGGQPSLHAAFSFAVLLPLLIALAACCWIAFGVGLTFQFRETSLAKAGWIERCGALVLLTFATVVTTSLLR
jgi:threonine/homoserine/homoserine lactone efflux protein